MSRCRYYSSTFWNPNVCNITGKNESIPESQYRRYCCNDYNMKSCNIYRNYMSRNSGGCYLTTIVCNTLGMDDKVSYLETLRKFRDNVLQKNDKYKEILATYDVVGPVISCNLAHDKNNKQIALNLFNLGIKNVCSLLDENRIDEAISLYMDMTNLLIDGYGIRESYDSSYLDTMDISKAGHGRKLVK